MSRRDQIEEHRLDDQRRRARNAWLSLVRDAALGAVLVGALVVMWALALRALAIEHSARIDSVPQQTEQRRPIRDVR